MVEVTWEEQARNAVEFRATATAARNWKLHHRPTYYSFLKTLRPKKDETVDIHLSLSMSESKAKKTV